MRRGNRVGGNRVETGGKMGSGLVYCIMTTLSPITYRYRGGDPLRQMIWPSFRASQPPAFPSWPPLSRLSPSAHRPPSHRLSVLQPESVAFVKSHALIDLHFAWPANDLRALVRASGDKTALSIAVFPARFLSKP